LEFPIVSNRRRKFRELNGSPDTSNEGGSRGSDTNQRGETRRINVTAADQYSRSLILGVLGTEGRG